MIVFIHHRLNLHIAYVLKTATFGKVSPDQTIDVFILSTLPEIYPFLSVHVLDGSFTHLYSTPISGKSFQAIRPATPLSIFGFSCFI